MLTEITIKRFKNIKEINLPLERINILIGSNNSGKSSILQSLQFAVSIAQTLKSVGTEWRTDASGGSFPAAQLVYTPLRDIASLVPERNFRERVPGVEVTMVGEHQIREAVVDGEPNNQPAPKSVITMKKGRGDFINCSLKGEEIGKLLEPMNPPFSVYVPGLAGIPAFEEHKSEVLVRRAAARGDANSVFRNILWLLRQDAPQWQLFTTDFQRIFPDRIIDVEFRSNQDEHINATIRFPTNEPLPIDAAGTGILQAIQILAYINLYKPRLLILDEPDAHLHPNNQRRLATVLAEIAAQRNFQILLSTHSRHLLDALRDDAKIHWIRNGTRVPDDQYSDVHVLMDVGALDRGDLLRAGRTKCVVLTEDADVSCIKALIEAAGFVLVETEIWSYEGCSKLDTALTLAAFIREHAPATKVVFHRDRDYMTDQECTDYIESLKKGAPQAFIFLTAGTDSESHFLIPEHFASLDPALELAMVTELIDRATTDSADGSRTAFINSRAPIETTKLRKENKQLNLGEYVLECGRNYDADPLRYRHGKKVIRRLRHLLQSDRKPNPDPFKSSQFVKDPTLSTIATAIWPRPASTTSTAQP
jgi:ABC-type uncharacterized transport system ATPase subunit